MDFSIIIYDLLFSCKITTSSLRSYKLLKMFEAEFGAKERKKVMFPFIIDLFNFPERENEILEHLIQVLTKNSIYSRDIIIDKIFRIFSFLASIYCDTNYVYFIKKKKYGINSIINIYIQNDSFHYANKNEGRYIYFDKYLHSIGPQTQLNNFISRISLPQDKYQSLIKKNNSDIDLVSLFMRYSMFGVNTGMFWSMNSKLYKYISSENGIKSVEGFASPFNHNLETFYSPFEKDKLFGSKGTFDDLLNKSSPNKKLKIIANPPYTEKIIEKTCISCLNFVEKSPQSQYIMMLPNWDNMDIFDQLKEKKIVDFFVFSKGNYTLTDHLKKIDLMPPIEIIFFVITGKKCNFQIGMKQIRNKMKTIVKESISKNPVLNCIKQNYLK